MSDFQRVTSLLSNWPANGSGHAQMETSLGVRIRRALRGVSDPNVNTPGALDLAGLLSHLLRRETLRQGDQTVRLRVPREDGWPSAELWSRCLCRVAQTLPGHFLLEGQPWHPDWLTYPGPQDPLRPALLEEPRRRQEFVQADPAIEEVIGFSKYRSPGQRMAVRSALLLQPGGTLLVVLPTGEGKSLVLFARALLGGASTGLTLVIVPTVALALDQARRAREILRGHPGANAVETWAYHGGLTSDEKTELRRRIREGTQPILYTSPEAAMLSLRPALLDAARAGRLRTLAVDEAHLVAQWGTEFRPEFQALAGLRRTLLAACGDRPQFQTLLLTATLTEEAWWTLQTLFGDGGLEVCASVSLRPEPDFFLSAATDSQRVQRVAELAHVLPRPFVLYTTRRDDCDDWAARLRNAGLHRLGKIHGGTGTTDREQTLKRWANRDLDVMVATSAFGLGMDQSDVRAVVHACVPETIDRFYQEVGRGGRDGNASLSFMVHTQDDSKLAETLNRDRVISVDKGLRRWEAMHRTAESAGDSGALLVRLDAKPASVSGDSEANVAWNLRTLVLMARAGLLRLEAHTPPEVVREDGETDEAFAARREAAFDDYATLARVRPADVNHLDKTVWEGSVQQHRLASRQAEQEANEQLARLLSGQEPFSKIFGPAYSISEAGITVGTGTLSCPATRRAGNTGRAGRAPAPRALEEPLSQLGPSLRRAVGPASRVLVSLGAIEPGSKEAKHMRRRLVRLMERLVMDGLREISAPDEWLSVSGYRRLYRHAQPRLVIHTSGTEGSAPWEEELAVARLSLLWPRSNRDLMERTLGIQRPVHLVLLGSDVPDLDRPDRPFLDTRPHFTLSDFERRLG